MRNVLALIILLIPACTLFQTPISPQTPRETLVVAEKSYQAAINTIAKMAELKQIPKDDLKPVIDMVLQAREALDKAHAAVVIGDPNAVTLINIANGLVTQLVLYLDKKGAT